MQSEGECSAVTAGSERLGFRKQDLGIGGGLGCHRYVQVSYAWPCLAHPFTLLAF